MLVVFAIYNASIYTQDCASSEPTLSEKAIEGQILWQGNNCSSCHQLYGLGGYLGPDLTNVISNPAKGPGYVRAFLKAGYKSMPQFDFDSTETASIVQFLSEVDKTGYSPVKSASLKASGWLELNYK